MAKYTELSTLGEFGLIDHLTRPVQIKNQSTLKGVGDDAAVLSYGKKKILVSTDMLIQGIHFDLTYTPLKHLGYKSVAVNVSDIYAMNGTPRQITVALPYPIIFPWKAWKNYTLVCIWPVNNMVLIWLAEIPHHRRQACASALQF